MCTSTHARGQRDSKRLAGCAPRTEREAIEVLKKRRTTVIVTSNMQKAARVSDGSVFFLWLMDKSAGILAWTVERKAEDDFA